ncbi:MAG: hypothetical protein RLZ51_2507 [Pseudomonadota bacterium]
MFRYSSSALVFTLGMGVGMGTAAGLLPGAAFAQPAVSSESPVSPDYGRSEYLSNCAGCHGIEGRGDGHFREFLVRAPADLSRLSRENQGVFPVQRVIDVIDGRTLIAGHGQREMPIWGADYRAQAHALYGGSGPVHAESYVRYRIQLLIGYLMRLQQP